MKAKQSGPRMAPNNASKTNKAKQLNKGLLQRKNTGNGRNSTKKTPTANKANFDIKRLKKMLNSNNKRNSAETTVSKTLSARSTPQKPKKKPKNSSKPELEKQRSNVTLPEAEKTNKTKFFKLKPKPSLLEAAKSRLEGARFRHLNEQLYTITSDEAVKLFKNDPQAFNVYHQGFQQQVLKWPVNPLHMIIADIHKMSKKKIIADFGCGEAQLAQSVPNKVHSFDLVAANEHVTACDMAHVPLTPKSVDVAVFCLSLMGTNLPDFLIEANRVLQMGGLLKVAEVESRCENVESFLKVVEKYGFQLVSKNVKDVFFLAEFKKTAGVKTKPQWGDLVLKPCIYKKR